MKNKKKLSQTHVKNQSKHDRHQPAVLLKKSPIKQKPNPPKIQTITSFQGSSLHQFNKTNIFYGKKYHYGEINPKRAADSNQSSTHCSFNNRSNKQKSSQNRKNKSKSLKGFKNQQLRYEQIQEQDEVQIRLNSTQILQLINSYATKIQRQWRRYWFRKCLRFIILKERQRKQYEILNSYYGSDMKSVENVRISHDFQPRIPLSYKEDKEKKRQSLPKLPVNNLKRTTIDQVQYEQENNESHLRRQQQTSNDNQLTEQFYNNKKYASLSSIHSGKLISNADISAKIKQSRHDRTSSLGQNVQNCTQNTNKSYPKSPQMVQIGLNCSLNQLPQNHTHFSTPVNGLRGIQDSTQKKSSDKKINIKLQTKVYEWRVDEVKQDITEKDIHKPSQHYLSKNLIEQFKRVQHQSPNIKSAQSLNKKYDTKFPSSQNLQKGPFEMTRMFKKYKKAIQKQGNKKISKIMKHFQQKQITERTYKNLIQQTKQKLNKQIKTLQLKEGHIQNSWKEIYVMYKDYVRENSFHQGQTLSDNKKIKEDFQNDEHSISFDRWDFQSSAKKSISQLESFEDFARELNQRNPQKLKHFFIQTKKITTDNKPIELVLDELDQLENDFEKSPSQVSEFKDEGGSIYEEFQQRDRTSSFQKKNQHVLVQNIAEKITQKMSYADMKSPHVSPRLSPKQANIFVKRNSKCIPDQQETYTNENQYVEAKRVHFEFPQISTPPKSVQRQAHRQETVITVPEKSTITEKIKTDESEEDSQVEMKITSIKIGQKQQNSGKEKVNQKSKKVENELFIPQNHKQKLKNSLLRQAQAKKDMQKKEQIKQVNQKRETAIKFINSLSNNYYEGRIIARRSSVIRQLEKMMSQVYRDKQRRRQQQEMELRKYPATIDPTIDAINSWLLQISHHLLDHHNAQVRKNLTSVKQLPRQQMLQISHSQPLANVFFHNHVYVTITQKIFKQFQFFYLKNVAHNLQIDQQHQQNFQHLLYGFHRCLIDCMNLTLLDELSIGRNWVVVPWIRSFRYRKKQTTEHSKQCLERAINRVSGWAEYSLAQLEQNADPSQINQLEWKQYQEEKMNIVIKQQVLEFPLENDFVLSNLLIAIANSLLESQLILAAQQLTSMVFRQS